MKFQHRQLKNQALFFILFSLFGCDANFSRANQINSHQGYQTPSEPVQNLTKQNLTNNIAKNIPTEPKKTPNNNNNNNNKTINLRFSLPPKGAPGNRGGAGSRDICAVKGKPTLTALIPGKNFGQTISERPTFWFYLPYRPNVKTPVNFKLTNAENKVVYQSNFLLTNTPGVVSITLPANAPILEVDKIYEWNLYFSCNPQNQLDIARVYGAVERVNLSSSVKEDLAKMKGRERIIFYANQGLWYELLTELIALRSQNPQDTQLAKDWQDLLNQSPEIELDKIINEPVVDCCKPNK
jgi:hypothetical protein